MIKIEVDEDIYSYEALRIAKNIVDKKEALQLVRKGKTIEILSKEDDQDLINNFLNEALAQQCRIDTVKNNYDIAEMITTLSIVNALNPKEVKKGGKE